MKALNGDDSTAGAITAGTDAVASKSSDDDDLDSSESSSSSSEESKEEKNTPHHHKNAHMNSKVTKKGAPRSNNDEGDVSSVTTRQNKTERSHYNLRMAIDEKFIPKSIKNLRYAAYLIFTILLMLSSKSLNSSLKIIIKCASIAITHPSFLIICDYFIKLCLQ